MKGNELMSYEKRKTQDMPNLLNYNGLIKILSMLGIVSLSSLHCCYAGENMKNTMETKKYYVSPNGSDNENGSAEHPFATIQKAADAAGPGSQIIVRAGTYREYVTIKNSGTGESPVIFSGERGSNGEWKTIIDPGIPVTKWEPAPEIGSGVYKTTGIPFRPYCMTLDGKLIVRISDNLMELGEKGKSLKELTSDSMNNNSMGGFTLLSLPENTISSHGQLCGKTVDFWDGVEVMYGYVDKKTYIRFRNGENPNGKSIKASDKKPAVNIADKSNIIIRDFMICGARESIFVEGKKARNNIIENNCLKHGINRVHITSGSSNNIVKNNIMTLGYLRGELFRAGSQDDKLGRHLYTVFKYMVGPHLSDDRGVYINAAGKNNEACGNIIYGGLLGISVKATPDLNIHDNIICNMSSVGLVTATNDLKENSPANKDKCVSGGKFYDNMIYDCGINLRIHCYANYSIPRKEYFYGNLLYQPKNAGMQIFVCHLRDPWPLGNLDEQQIYIYQNTIYNGSFFHIKGSLETLKKRGFPENRRLSFFLVNNMILTPITDPEIIERTRKQGTELFANNLLFTTIPGNIPVNNISVSPAEESKCVSLTMKNTPLGAMPYLQLPLESPARHAGIDLSQSFTVDGKQYPSMPGMKKGYFNGNTPDLGAFQNDKLNEKFFKMFSVLKNITQ